MNNISEYVRERNDAFLSLDKERIVAFCEKYNPGGFIPEGKTFWLSVHKTICNIKSATPEEKARSEKWLSENGSTPIIIGSINKWEN